MKNLLKRYIYIFLALSLLATKTLTSLAYTPNSTGVLTVDDGTKVNIDSSDFTNLYASLTSDLNVVQANLQSQIDSLSNDVILTHQQYVATGKAALASAITERGGTIGSATEDGQPTFDALIDGINSIPNINTELYTFPVGSTGDTKDLGKNNTYRYVNATNVYNKGKADSQTQMLDTGYIMPQGTKTITDNGVYDVTNYAAANISIGIPSGYIKPNGTVSITSNGTHNVNNYETAYINVPIPGGYVYPSGTRTITSNGTYDVSNYAYASVSISGTTPSGTKDITSNGTYDVTNYASANVNVTGNGGNYSNRKVSVLFPGDTSCTMTNKYYVVMASILNSTYATGMNNIAGTNGLQCSAGAITWYPYSKVVTNAEGQTPWYSLYGFINVGSNSSTTFTKHSTASNLYYVIIGLENKIMGPFYTARPSGTAFKKVTVSYGTTATVVNYPDSGKGILYQSSISGTPSYVTTKQPSGTVSTWPSSSFTLPYNSSYEWLFLSSIRYFKYDSTCRESYPILTYNMMQKSATATTTSTSNAAAYVDLNKFTLENLVYQIKTGADDSIFYAGIIHQNDSTTAGWSGENGLGLGMWIAVAR